jgi:hypothetical protein
MENKALLELKNMRIVDAPDDEVFIIQERGS